MLAYGDYRYGWQLLFVLLTLTVGKYASAASSDLQLENELLLELRLDGENLGVDILGYQRGEDFLLSLDELTTALRFPIDIDAGQGSASGWFITQDRVFTLDLKRAVVVSHGRQWPILDGEVVTFQGGLFVDTKALEKWFPLRLFAILRELYIDVEPAVPLPIQLRNNRRARSIARSSSNPEPQYPLQPTPYQFFSPHITRFTSSYSTVRQSPGSKAEYGINYASLSRGDLGWMTSTLSLAGHSDDALTAARLRLERTAFDGPLGLNHIEFGDVGAGGAGVVLRGGGRGDRINNEMVTLEGSQLPDWDVELYQNGQLIMIQTTGADGRYLFEDVPLLFGENRFELKFFGPNGEVETREEFHFLGQDMLPPGTISYEVSALQSGRTVFDINDAGDGSDNDNGIYSTGVNIGLSRNLSLRAGVRSQESDDERLYSRNAGIGLSTSRYYASVSYIDVPDAQDSIGTSVRTRLGDAGLSLGYTRFFDALGAESSPKQWQAEVDLSAPVLSVPVKFEITAQESQNSSVYGVNLGATKPLSGAGQLSSSLWYSSVETRLDSEQVTSSQLGGQSSIYTVVNPWSFRLSARYGFEPESSLHNLSGESFLRIASDLSLDLRVGRNLATDTTSYGSGVSWRSDKLTINARVSYNSKERWGGLITLSTALAHKPGTLLPRLDSLASVDSGTVEVHVFEDVNGTQGERYSDVDVAAVQSWRRATTDGTGVAYLSRVPSFRQTDIELDESTLNQYELKSKNPGVSIIPRPGSYAIVEFPIVRTSELEGHVVSGDEKTPVSRALVQLQTMEGELVAQTRSAFDGFYLFEGIEAGTYQMSLDETSTRRILSGPDSVTVLADSGVVRGLNFTLGRVKEKAIALDTLVKEQELQEQPVPILIPPTLAAATPEPEAQVKTQTDDGKWFVQIGAYGSREIAQAAWKRFSEAMQLLQTKTPRYADFRDLVRLLVGPGRSRVAASELCQQLKSRQLDCMVRSME